jgi:hypothetical protein
VAGQRWRLERMRVYWVFSIVFSLFLNKNIFSLNRLLVAIYGVNFYSFSRIFKNNRISFQSVFCFLIILFSGSKP